MIRNYLAWKRPEGQYPDRDGLFIAVVPTIPVKPARLTPIRRTPRGQEDREQRRPWRSSRPRSRAGWRGCRRLGTSAVVATTTTPSPANEAMTWRSVSCVAYRPRESG